MSARFKQSNRTKTLIYMAILTALVAVLNFIKIPLPGGLASITLVLPVVVIGGALYGPWVGAWLGAVAAFMILITGEANFFLFLTPPVTYFTTPLLVIVKTTAAGLLSGLAYRLFAKKNKMVATALSAVIAPTVNTGIYLLGCLVFFSDLVAAWFSASSTTVSFVFLTLGVGNYFVELAINILLCPAIVRLIDIFASKKANR